MTDAPTKFTFASLKAQYETALKLGYEFCTCRDYIERKREGRTRKLVVNRVDVDFNVRRAEKLGELYRALGLRATFFIRLHAPEYNPFSFENYRIIRALIADGHEIGYHSEVVDQAALWSESAEACLERDLATMRTMFGTEIVGAASHGGMTGLNNLDFWKDRRPRDHDLLYEGYDREPEFGLFHESLYVSDSEWTRWKCYDRGKLVEGDRRSFGEHVLGEPDIIYLLIHSDTYFDRHFYE